ncbi:MAG: hypothetical protein H6732_04330 [Alphaproteobacteria bacterium]|nr:hypothetical protein [Alphaproteobacteria bacterium]
MDFVVDEMGNCWASDDDRRTEPVLPHPELEGARQRCPKGLHYVYRVKLSEQDFEWRCACGQTYPGWHH